jgi:hypothetical protein
MNRRAFMAAGTSTLVASTVGIGSSRRASAQSGPNTALYSACAAAHAIASGNLYYGTPTASDWTTIQNTLNGVYGDWTANGLDAQVNGALSRISPSSVTSANMNQAQILATIQMYQPAFTAAQVQQLLTYVAAPGASNVSSIMENMQAFGTSYYINQLSVQAGKVAAVIQNGTAAVERPLSVVPSFKPTNPPTNPGPGGAKYNCATDGALIFAAGIAFAVLTVMTAGTDAVLIGGAWGSIAAWGGLGTTGWGAGHVIAGCGF